jgi:hypothetical protein
VRARARGEMGRGGLRAEGRGREREGVVAMGRCRPSREGREVFLFIFFSLLFSNSFCSIFSFIQIFIYS